MGLCHGAEDRVGCWVSRRSCRHAYVPGGRRATRTLELQHFHLRGPWQALGFFFFFLSRGFAWNSDAHVVQNSLAPTSGAPCKSHLPAQAGQAAAGLGHVGAARIPSWWLPLPTSGAGGLQKRCSSPANERGTGKCPDARPGRGRWSWVTLTRDLS